MMRMAWLAVGPLLILGVGAVLIWGQPREDAPKPVETTAFVLPSGLEAEFHEMIWNQPGQGLTYRFRFVAPAFESSENVEQVMADLQYLCMEYALPKLANTGPMPGQVIISLADQISEFGTYNPDVRQVFEAFEIKNDACMWEMF